MQDVASFGSLMMMTVRWLLLLQIIIVIIIIIIVIIKTGQMGSYLSSRCSNFLPKDLMQEYFSVNDLKGNLYRRDIRESSYTLIHEENPVHITWELIPGEWN